MEAANLNKQVIIMGAGYLASDEVNSPSMSIRLYDKIVGLQVLQYNKRSATWTEIGKMRLERNYHATVEVDLSIFCAGRKKMGISLITLS